MLSVTSPLGGSQLFSFVLYECFHNPQLLSEKFPLPCAYPVSGTRIFFIHGNEKWKSWTDRSPSVWSDWPFSWCVGVSIWNKGYCGRENVGFFWNSVFDQFGVTLLHRLPPISDQNSMFALLTKGQMTMYHHHDDDDDNATNGGRGVDFSIFACLLIGCWTLEEEPMNLTAIYYSTTMRYNRKRK